MNYDNPYYKFNTSAFKRYFYQDVAFQVESKNSAVTDTHCINREYKRIRVGGRVKMETMEVSQTSIKGALITTKVEGGAALKRAMYYAIFALLIDVLILPLFIIVNIYLAAIMVPYPDSDDPGDAYLCQCCDQWEDRDNMYYCCQCTGHAWDEWDGGNTTRHSIVLGLYDLCTTAVIVFSFLFSCLWGTSCLESLVKSISLFGTRYTNGGIRTAIGERLIQFIGFIILYATKPDFNCQCISYSSITTYSMELGPQYKAFNAYGIVAVFHLVFLGIFLLSRRILLCLLRNVKITSDMVLFQLCYINIEQISSNSNPY